MFLKGLLLIFFSVYRTDGRSVFEEMEPGTVLSRFDYDYKMIMKVTDLESKISDLERRLQEVESKSATGSLTRTECLDGWLAFRGSCYLIGTHSVDFLSAKAYCLLRDSYLVHVDSEAENLFLKTFMNNHLKENYNYWIGMNDDITEGVWKFTEDKKQVTYFDWGPTEPQDAGSGEDCAAYYHPLQYQWVDISCTAKVRPLCEKRNYN